MNAAEKEQLRHSTLQVLASRHPAALPRRGVLNRVAQEIDFKIELSDVVTALEFLKGLGHAESLQDEFGVSDYWKATSSGVLVWERSERPGTAGHD